MDSLLIMLVIFAITGISGWLQRKAQSEKGSPPGQDPRRPRTGPQSGGTDRSARQTAQTSQSESPPNLETQLRRWLQKEFSQEEESPPVMRTEPQPAPPPLPPPVSMGRTKTKPPEAPSVTQHAHVLDSHLRSATQAKEDAKSLYKETLEHLKKKGTRRDANRKVPSIDPAEDEETTRELVDAVAMLENPQTVRQALIASFILAPPKALDESPGI